MPSPKRRQMKKQLGKRPKRMLLPKLGNRLRRKKPPDWLLKLSLRNKKRRRMLTLSPTFQV